MPRNTRNFWIEYEGGDGHKVATGPKGKEQGFRLDILIRQDGGISDNRLVLHGNVNSDGTLTVTTDGKCGVISLLNGRR